jgi:hypothetical protein
VKTNWFSSLTEAQHSISCPNGVSIGVIRSDHLPHGVLPPSVFQYQPPAESIYMRLMEDLKEGECKATNTDSEC